MTEGMQGPKAGTMQIKTLEELQCADERALAFTPMGLGHMEAADAAEYQQQVVSSIELAADVAPATRRAFERLRTAYAHGVLCYEIYTLVHDHALLIVEQALRDRLMEHYDNAITFVTKQGETKTIETDDYEEVFQACSGKWHLLVGDDGPPLQFNGMLPNLTAWARRVGYFRGQQNRRQEEVHGDLRNMVAHGSPHLTKPIEAASELRAAAEIINQLWGEPTTDGKYYPAPKPRHLIAIGWSDAGGIQRLDAHHLATDPSVHQDRKYIIVKAVADDSGLWDFNSLYEMTSYPAEWLWGPGTVDDAVAWMQATDPVVNDQDHLDRVFAIRTDDGYLYAPQRPEIAAAAVDLEQAGEWFVVRADHPSHARVHIRNRLTTEDCQEDGPCKWCSAELLAHGTYSEVGEVLRRAVSRPLDQLPPAVSTPGLAPYRVKIL
jgi:hypothetical protein